MKVKVADVKTGKNYSRPSGIGDISELVGSFQQHGQLQPIIVDPELNLSSGYRRLAAAQELEWEEIEAIQCSADPRIVNLIENMNREGLSLWDEIQGIEDVFGRGTPQADICRALSKSRSWVRPRVEIWKLPQDFINKVRMGMSGVKEILGMLSEKRGQSAVSRNMGVPSQPDIKRMVTWLMQEDRDAEARALSYAVGAIDEETLKQISEKGDC